MAAATTVLPHDAGNVVFHRTDYLKLGLGDERGHGMLTHLYFSWEPHKRLKCLLLLRRRRYTHIYIYARHEKDYPGGKPFNVYRWPWEQTALMLLECQVFGVYPVLWLEPDDAPIFDAHELVRIWNRWIPLIDPYAVGGYCLGLEWDEYRSTEEQRFLARQLRRLTKRPIFVHWTGGRRVGYDWPETTGIIYQFRRESCAVVPDMLRHMLHQLQAFRRPWQQRGKVFIAGEYAQDIRQGLSEREARAFGSCFLAAGADGFGNGGPGLARRSTR